MPMEPPSQQPERHASPKAARRLLEALSDDIDGADVTLEPHATDCPHGCTADRFCEHGWQSAQGSAGIG